MRRFLLFRAKDVSGISGTGIIAEGVQLTSGTCILNWLTSWPDGEFSSVTFYPHITRIEEVHGHNGNTVIRWLDPEFAA